MSSLSKPWTRKVSKTMTFHEQAAWRSTEEVIVLEFRTHNTHADLTQLSSVLPLQSGISSCRGESTSPHRTKQSLRA
jgi:hypothetical protein